MGKDAWKAFLRWLDQADPQELAKRHQESRALLATLTDVHYRSDLRRIIRLIEEEQLIRAGIHQRMAEGDPKSQG